MKGWRRLLSYRPFSDFANFTGSPNGRWRVFRAGPVRPAFEIDSNRHLGAQTPERPSLLLIGTGLASLVLRRRQATSLLR
jgi:hypothetical protein